MSDLEWDSEVESEEQSSAEEPQASPPPASPVDWPSDPEDDPEDRVPLARRRVPRRSPVRGRQAVAGGMSTRGHRLAASASSRVEVDSPEGASSTVTGLDLAKIRARYQTPREIDFFIPTPDDRVISSRPGRVAIYEFSLKAGLRPPFPAFFINLLDYYSLTPSQLVPNSLRTVSAFMILCHHLHITPRISLFRAFYILRAQRGWWLFQPRPHRALKFHLPTSVKGWKSRFFFANLSQVKPRWGDPDVRGNMNSGVLPGDKEALGQMLTTNIPWYNLLLSEENFQRANLTSHRGKFPHSVGIALLLPLPPPFFFFLLTPIALRAAMKPPAAVVKKAIAKRVEAEGGQKEKRKEPASKRLRIREPLPREPSPPARVEPPVPPEA